MQMQTLLQDPQISGLCIVQSTGTGSCVQDHTKDNSKNCSPTEAVVTQVSNTLVKILCTSRNKNLNCFNIRLQQEHRTILRDSMMFALQTTWKLWRYCRMCCGLSVRLKNTQSAWHATTTTAAALEYCKSVGKHVEKLQIRLVADQCPRCQITKTVPTGRHWLKNLRHQ